MAAEVNQECGKKRVQKGSIRGTRASSAADGGDRHQASRHGRNRGHYREPLTSMPSALMLTWAMAFDVKHRVKGHPRQSAAPRAEGATSWACLIYLSIPRTKLRL
jgi:hypothetical protein